MPLSNEGVRSMLAPAREALRRAAEIAADRDAHDPRGRRRPPAPATSGSPDELASAGELDGASAPAGDEPTRHPQALASEAAE